MSNTEAAASFVDAAISRSWDGEAAVEADHPASGTSIGIFVHSTTLGPALGGTRLQRYAARPDAAADGVRLAEAMTLKNALAGLPIGGGKAVISAGAALPAGTQRKALMRFYGDLVEQLGGRYITAPDLNTSPRDMDVVSQRTRHVVGKTPAHGGAGTTAVSTAEAVCHSLRAVLSRLGLDAGEATVAVQGAGAVGSRLAALLVQLGVRVKLADPRAELVKPLADRIGAAVVDPVGVLMEECDVLAPCALGGVIDPQTIPRLRCHAIVGAANNQLQDPDRDSRALHERGIVYIPDFLASCGGVLQGAGREVLGWTQEELDARLAAVGETTATILADAAANAEPPYLTALHEARRRLRASATEG